MAGLIAPATLEQIRAASDIVEVIGASLHLKRAGANFVALCPFHKEKTPSFSVNPHKQIFYCFGCHKGGDVFTFIREYEGLTFLEAVKRLADRASIPLQFENQPGQRQAEHLKETLWQIHEQVARRWQNALANEAGGQIARDYLARRGVPEEAVQLFRLGYAPEAWDDTVNWGRSKDYAPALLEQAGLIIRKEGTDRYYDRFRGRLMFPICDEQGRVIAFSGRVLSGDEKTAKYVNSPETPIFTKGKVFYGLDKSRRALVEAGSAVICEGQLDLIACYMGGVRNIVAPQGTAFTADHARILKRYVNEVVLCFDSDNAGQNAAVRVLDSLLASDLAIRVAVVPAPHDPDSFIKEQGGEAFQALIARAEGFFDFYLKRLCATNDVRSDLGRRTVVSQMREAVWKTGDQVLRDACAQKTAQQLGVSADAVRAEFRKNPKSTGPVTPGEDIPSTRKTEKPPPEEFFIAKALFGAEEIVDFLSQHLDLAWFRTAAIAQIAARRLEAHRNKTWTSVGAFLGLFDDPETQSTISHYLSAEMVEREDGTRHVVKPMNSETMPEVVSALKTLRDRYISRQRASLDTVVNDRTLPDEQRHEAIRRKHELRLLMQKPIEAPK